MASVMLATTLGLGFWQLQRLHWKLGVLAELARAERAPPVPLASSPMPYARVTVAGTFEAIQARYGAEVRPVPGRGSEMGSRVLSVLTVPGQQPLLVDRGWAPATMDLAPPQGRVELVGYVRPGDRPSWFSPVDDVAKRNFYTMDPARIGAALGYPAVVPFVLVEFAGPAGLPMGATELPQPSNDHLSYAITWFSLSAALIVIFVFYVRRVSHEASK